MPNSKYPMTAKTYAEHISAWCAGKKFNGAEDMLVAIENQTRNILTASTIVRFASVSYRGPGYRFAVGDGGLFCHLTVHATGNKVLTVTKVSAKPA